MSDRDSKADKIEGFIARLAPEPVCDACIAERLGVDDSGLVQHCTHEIAGTRGYVRETAACALCSSVGMTTRKARR